jgi:hypothetical protein
MNVMSRSFLKDFYDILPDYNLYRLHKDGLIRLGNYDSSNEIFLFQNIIACLKEVNVDHLLVKR